MHISGSSRNPRWHRQPIREQPCRAQSTPSSAAPSSAISRSCVSMTAASANSARTHRHQQTRRRGRVRVAVRRRKLGPVPAVAMPEARQCRPPTRRGRCHEGGSHRTTQTCVSHIDLDTTFTFASCGEADHLKKMGGAERYPSSSPRALELMGINPRSTHPTARNACPFARITMCFAAAVFTAGACHRMPRCADPLLHIDAVDDNDVSFSSLVVLMPPHRCRNTNLTAPMTRSFGPILPPCKTYG